MSDLIKEMVCIVCPRGCHLKINTESLAVSGNTCEKGEAYAKAEVTHPVRTITGTAAIDGALHGRLPVRTSSAVPKELIPDIMREIHSLRAVSPVKRGDVLIKGICGTEADLIATKDM